MIQKSDVVLLLTELQSNGEDVDADIAELYKSPTIPISILKKIHSNKPLDLFNFYEKLRRSYNAKKSKLYLNIMKSDENAQTDANTILTTLSALLNQILQFNADDRVMFYKHARADEIAKVLSIYFSTFNLTPAYDLLKLIKADICVLEFIDERRKL